MLYGIAARKRNKHSYTLLAESLFIGTITVQRMPCGRNYNCPHSNVHVRRKLHLSQIISSSVSPHKPLPTYPPSSKLLLIITILVLVVCLIFLLLSLPLDRRPSASLLSLFGIHYLHQCVRMNPYLPSQDLLLIFSTVMREKYYYSIVFH